MSFVSDIKTTAPDTFATPLQQKTYETLNTLGIAYERVDCAETITMEDCAAVDERLQMQTVKTLFLSNRQQTEFYLFVTPGDKRFVCRDFAAALGVSRPSFAPAELMLAMIGTEIGAATVFGTLLESARGVRVIIDRDVLSDPFFGCTDGTTTCYMKLRTTNVLDRLLPYAGHTPEFIRV